jgi:hypothetical protein
MATVGSFGIDLGLNTARFEEGLKRAGTGADRFQRGFKSAMVGLAGAATVAAGAFAAVSAAVATAIDRADGIGDMAAAAGVGTAAFQAWAQAAELAGVSNESFASGLGRATRLIGDAARGIGPGAKALENLGIAARDAAGNVKSTEAVIAELADKISAMKSPAEQASAASALLGRDLGPKMVGFLSQGGAGIQAYTEQLRAMGGIISDEVIQQADEAEKQLKAMSQVVTAQLTSGLVALTPVITGVAQAFANAAPHVTRFFNILRGGNLDAIAGQMGTVSAELNRLRTAQASANAQVEKDMFGRLIADAEKRLRELQDKYGQMMRAGRLPEAEPAAQVPSSAPTATGTGPVARVSAAVEAAAEDTGKKAGQKAGIAYARELSLAIDTSMKETATLDKFAVMTEAAAAAANDWAEQSEVAAGRIADSLEYVVFAGFRDGVKGMRDAFRATLQDMIIDLGRSKLREVIAGMFKAEGGGNSSISNILGAVVGAFGGGGGGKGGATGGLKGFAQGGSFTVPGPSTGDNVIPLFRANGGETVTVTPKGQGGGLTMVVNNDFRGADPGSEARLLQAQKQNNEILKRQISDLLRRNRL